MRLIKSIKLSEGGRQVKICWRIISVGLDRPSKPRDRLLATAEVKLRNARASHPDVGHRVAWTETQGLVNVGLCFFGATDQNLTKSDKVMGAGEISIQRQRMFTFSDPLRSALGKYVDKSQVEMCARMVRDGRQGFGQLRFGRREGRHGIGRVGEYARDRVRCRRSDERVDIVGVSGERAIEKAASLREIVRGRPTLIEPSKP